MIIEIEDYFSFQMLRQQPTTGSPDMDAYFALAGCHTLSLWRKPKGRWAASAEFGPGHYFFQEGKTIESAIRNLAESIQKT